MSRARCGACGRLADHHCWRLVHLCEPCKRLAKAWCWRKLQGLEREHILPRYEETPRGQAYLCILCGYWHWTSETRDPLPETVKQIWALSRYFERRSFHVNVARGYANIRHLPT